MEAKVLHACPVATTLTLISDKWKVLIIRDLLPGKKRFGELKKSIGSVSQKVLTSQLRQMEESGLLIRTVFPEVPPRVEYTLTELGQSLKPVLGNVELGRRIQGEKRLMDRKVNGGSNVASISVPPKSAHQPTHLGPIQRPVFKAFE